MQTNLTTNNMTTRRIKKSERRQANRGIGLKGSKKISRPELPRTEQERTDILSNVKKKSVKPNWPVELKD